MRDLVLGKRRADTLSEAVLVAVITALALAAVLYGLSLAIGDVDRGRIWLWVALWAGLRLALGAVRVARKRRWGLFAGRS